ncbi:sulfotransferase family protein [Dongia sp.]|uniref:sulfotransferase family protein n=1 Tax=Dongia sp. TaxID=1977262 RepID=UPI003750227F
MGAETQALANIAELLQISWKTRKNARRANPLIVVGAPRSGTTLMTALLTNLPGAMKMIPEASFLVPILETYRKCLLLDERNDRAFFGGPAGVRRHFSNCINGIVSEIRTQNGGEFAVLKAPILSKFVGDILALLPDAQVICMVRHPVAVMRSMRSWGQKAAAAGRDHAYASATNAEIYALIRSYYSSPLAIRDRLIADRLLFVRFEDLVMRSPAVVQDVLALSGRPNADLDFSDPYRNSTIDFSAVVDERADAVTEFFGAPVDPGRAEQPVNYADAEIAEANAGCPQLLPYFYRDWRGQTAQTAPTGSSIPAAIRGASSK